jgi:hypothetical protein
MGGRSIRDAELFLAHYDLQSDNVCLNDNVNNFLLTVFRRFFSTGRISVGA